jgi:hypothetical protein
MRAAGTAVEPTGPPAVEGSTEPTGAALRGGHGDSTPSPG